MIARVSGRLAAKGIDRVEILTAGGVTYELQIPLGVLETLPRLGEEVVLHTALVVSDDDWRLFGFATAHERHLFNTLRSATGVGPALALGLLSALGPGGVVRAIRSRDLATLAKVPRVGRKTAERLCVELADRLATVGDDGVAAGGGTPGGAGEDAVRALVALGYAPPEAEKAVRAALAADPGGDAAAIVRASLAAMRPR